MSERARPYHVQRFFTISFKGKRITKAVVVFKAHDIEAARKALDWLCQESGFSDWVIAYVKPGEGEA